jgi:(E)-4-hydroxy-3-methylbut-2-enyl-diphosphate synthase
MIAECATLREKAEATIQNDTITIAVDAPDWETLQLKAAMAVGALLIDKKAHQLVIHNSGFDEAKLVELADGILQAARIKFTKTEYISCPGCGRTLYNLQETIAKIKAATKDLVGLKIGIMGCIVNGPGEMADADYGYVGAGRGKISLYKAKECVEKNIPEEEAVEKLLDLIRKDREQK